MEESNSNTDLNTENPFPFNNLFLIKGYVTGKNKPWMYVAGILAAFLGYLFCQLLIMIPLFAAAQKQGIGIQEIAKNPNILFNPDVVGINKTILLAMLMGMFVFTLLFLWFVIRFIQRKTLGSVITGFENIRWRRYFFSFGIWTILLVLLTVISYIASPQDMELRFDASKFFMLLIVAMLLIPIQTATEEILFRGYLMQGLGLAFKNALSPLIITSVLFGLMHGSNPEVKEHGSGIMMPYYILFGLFLGVISLLDEGLELAMGIHCANNLVSSLLLCSKSSVLQTDAIFYTSAENPGAEFLAWVLMAAVCFFILYKKYKLSNWKLLMK